MIAEDNFFVLRCQGEVLFQPLHLSFVQLSRRVIRLALGEETVVDAHIVLIATVEGIVGRSEALLPLVLIECLAILVVVADDGEKPHIR